MAIPIPKTKPEKDYTEETNTSATGKKDKFKINLLQYPADLGSVNLKHYVEFQITVRGKSKFNKDNRLFEVKRNEDSANLSEEDLAKTGKNSTTIASGVLGYALSSKIFNIFDKTGALPKIIKQGASIAGAVGAGKAGFDAISAHKLLKPDTQYRISDVIALYVDAPPTVSYSMNYSNKELGTLAGILSGSSFNTSSFLGGSSESAAAFGAALAKLPGILGATNIQDVLNVSSKTSLNPFKEVIFESVDFRSFAFRYRFMPRSKREADEVERIIKMFKFHQHPELSDGKLFFIYPSEFNIKYYFEGSENTYFHKFAPCVLEKVDISYGGEQFSTFYDGKPTEINMSLIFRENEILTKDMIEDGY